MVSSNQLNTKKNERQQRELLIGQLQQLEVRVRSLDGVLRGIAIAIKKAIAKLDPFEAIEPNVKGPMTTTMRAVVQQKEDEEFSTFVAARLVFSKDKTVGLSCREVATYYSGLIGYNVPVRLVAAMMRRFDYVLETINTYGVKGDEQYRTTYKGYKGLCPLNHKHFMTTQREWLEKSKTAPGYNMRTAYLAALALKEQALNPYHTAVEEALNPDNDPNIEQVAELMDISYNEDIQL